MAGVTSKILDQHGRPMQRVEARYDAAQTYYGNERHWANADYMGPNAANNHSVRSTLKIRARYEAIENNSILYGLVDTLVNDTIGTIPRLKMTTTSRSINDQVEQNFMRWMREADIAAKLRTAQKSKVVDGESFGIIGTNPKYRTAVQLDWRLVESDQVTNEYSTGVDIQNDDGIQYDEWGNPVSYDVLKYHPGGEGDGTIPTNERMTIPADFVTHLYKSDRPGQRRGVSEIAPALNFVALHRRFLLATVRAAETAAASNAIIRTNTPNVDTYPLVGGEIFDWETDAMISIPAGWDISQMRSEHPATTFEMFHEKMVNLIARCLNIPLNIALADSSRYNYASGRLDHLVYWRQIDILRSEIERTILDRLFDMWLMEAMLIPGYLFRDGSFDPPSTFRHSWLWDRHRSADPLKEANAAMVLHRGGLLTDDQFWSESGKDTEEQYSMLERQEERRKELGLPSAFQAPMQVSKNVTEESPPDDTE